MAEKVTYCRFCNEDHIVSETMDLDNNAVGLFCNRKKAMLTAFSHKWNGEDVYERLEHFLDRQVDKIALLNIEPNKINGLSRKMAYLFLQTPYAKKHRINYHFVQYHANDIIRRMRSKITHRYGN